MNANYLVKVTDAKAPQVQKALQDAGITVRSVQEMYKEETAPEAADMPEAAGDKDKEE